MIRRSFFLMALVLIASSVYAQPPQSWSFDDVSSIIDHQPEYAGVVCWGDVNKDGYPDLFVGGREGTLSHLYLNDHGQFRDVTADYGLVITSNVRKAEFLDYNRDGTLDLFVVTDDAQGVRLFKQGVRSHYDEVVVTEGTTFTTPIRDAMWCDMDGNGTPDLVLSNGADAQSPMMIFTQSTGQEFVEMRDNPWEGLSGIGSITAADFDRDGHADYFFGWNSGDGSAHFFHDVNGTFEDWGSRFDFPRKLGRSGVAWLDYDNDGRMDMMCVGSPEYTAMYHGAWRYGAAGLEGVDDGPLVAHASHGVEVHPVDVNGDGWTDMFITKADSSGNVLLINNQGIGWHESAADVGIQDIHRPNVSAAFADMDRDLDMDLAVAQGDFGLQIYRNNLRNRRQVIEVNLLSSDTHTPVANCNVQMDWQINKQIASTFPNVSSGGTDAPSLLFVNRSDEKTEMMTLYVDWPNGIHSTYGMDKLRLGCVNNVYMPTPGNLALEPATRPTHTTLVAQHVSPNPFNPSTNISFNLTQAANVELKVYNLAGQEVAVLARGSYEAGEHRVAFNASALPSGVYFSRLTANGMSSMSRMLLMK
jgi:hypothetical protein